MAFRRLAKGKAVWAAAGLASAVLVPGVAFADKNEVSRQVFDPEALERAAAAAREVNKSPHAKQILSLSMQQETTKQAEAKKGEAESRERASENVRVAAQIEKERDAIRFEEERRLEEQRAQVAARMKQYEDELARKRLMHDHELQRNRNAELVKLQEAERLRVEQQIQAERRAADAYAADLQKQVQREKALAEAEGRIKEARDNEDVNRRAAILKYQEEARQALESINAVMSNLGSAAMEVVTDTNKMVTVVGGFSLLFLGFYTAKETTRVVGRTVETWLGTPKLVRETSRFSVFNPKSWSLGSPKTAEQIKKDFSDIILPEALHNNVRLMAASATNTRKHGAPFRHVMFYGPPGTGKTMAAKRLARTSGLDYAIMSGGDVSQLGAKAVTQLHETFDWAEKSRRGLLLFIDEADAFLGRRNSNMSEGLRGALNATLYRTGDQSKDFMVVLATNRPGDLDDAVIDRMDESLEFALPLEHERRNILNLYLDSYICKAGTSEGGAGSGDVGVTKRVESLVKGQKNVSDAIDVTDFDFALIDEAAKKMEGFSGRELAKFMASVQASAYGTVDGKLTSYLFSDVLERKLKEHQHRKEFQAGKNYV